MPMAITKKATEIVATFSLVFIPSFSLMSLLEYILNIKT